MIYIYALTDPRTNEIRYIGWTGNVSKRHKNHITIKDRCNSHKNNWIRQLQRLELQPEIIVLQEVPVCEREIAERAWIQYGYAEGWRLTNLTLGGDGMLGMSPSAEIRRKIGQAHKNKVLSEETKQKISEANKGKKPWLGKCHNEDTKKKISVSKMGKQPWLGKHHSEESRLKISQSFQGEKSPNSKLTGSDVLEMRRLYDSGEESNCRKLADMYNINRNNAYRIVKRQAWKHLP